MECQVCGEELDQGRIRIVRLVKEFDDHVKIGVCEDCLKAAEECLLARAAVLNRRGALEEDLAGQRKELKKI